MRLEFQRIWPISDGVTPTAKCPICQTDLRLVAEGDFNTWVCPDGHGLAATLTEAYVVAQEDDLKVLWQLARRGERTTSGARQCPMCAEPMIPVTAPVDEDEVPEGEAGDTPETDLIPVDVCADDQVIWFDAGEVDRLPADLPDAQPTPQQQAALAKIRSQFGESYEAALESHQGKLDRLTERIAGSSKVFGMIAKHLPGSN